ncbi:unnamed protein product [Dibothriocephalus latus]|uniref:Uncharacterized protein n=1 Tax=Dibothriocephalus latus TaxID=60516 RepID=A0A3P7NWL9_DIBLA|nr:unnamed protein product [Dibothriocephalus latus]
MSNINGKSAAADGMAAVISACSGIPERLDESEHCLLYTKACLECLANQLTYLGRLVAPPTQWAHPIRGPLSLHMPLSRHAACFLCLSVMTHKASLRDLMTPFMHPNLAVLRRLMEELANVLVSPLSSNPC